MPLLPRLIRPRRIYRGWWIVFSGYMALTISGGATSFVFSVLVKPMQDDLGWSRATIVGILTLAGIVSGLLAAPIGPLVDRHGPRALMTGAAIVGGLCFLSTSQVSEVWQYYLLLGLLEAATRPALDTVGPRASIANWFIRKRAPAFAFFTMGRATAGLFLVPPIAYLVEQTSWRSAWVVMGLLQLFLLAPLCWAFQRRRPEDEGLLPDGDSPVAGPRAEPSTGARPAPRVFEDVRWTVGQALRTRTFWLLNLGILLVNFPGASIYIHMSSYFQDKGMEAPAAAGALSVYALGALIGRAVWTSIILRLGLYRALVAFAVIYGSGILVFALVTGPWALVAAALALGISIGGSAQLQAQIWPDYFGRRIVGALSGYGALMVIPAGR
ncbi:MAG: MFS transporter [Chloroflexota bacterium]